MLDDVRGYKGLISAIITRAILDSLQQPLNKGGKMPALARSGLEFLLGDDIGLYLDFLNIDADYFKTNLLKNMFSDDEDPHFNSMKKRLFRMNFKRYEQEKNKKLIMMAEYKRRVKK